MKEPAAPDLRNLAILGHASARKTMLCEAMLACSGRLGRLGCQRRAVDRQPGARRCPGQPVVLRCDEREDRSHVQALDLEVIALGNDPFQKRRVRQGAAFSFGRPLSSGSAPNPK